MTLAVGAEVLLADVLDRFADKLDAAELLPALNAIVSLLPTTPPPGGGLWNNGGVLCIA